MSLNPSDDSPNTMRESGFRASLNGANLGDLVQMECLSGRERVVRVSSGSEVGYLFFRGGQIVHAVSRRATGEAAALEILRWNDGTFEPCSAGWPDHDSITCNWQNLLLLAAQQRDEQGRHNLVAFPGNRTAVVPRPAGTPSAPPPPMTPPPSAHTSTASGGTSALAQVRAAVRIDPAGNVLSSKGQADDLAEMAAYCARLAELVGDGLGMQNLVSIEVAQPRTRTLIYRERGGNTFALKADPETDLTQVRERLGL